MIQTAGMLALGLMLSAGPASAQGQSLYSISSRDTALRIVDPANGDTYKLMLQGSPGDLYSGQEVTVWGWSTDSGKQT